MNKISRRSLARYAADELLAGKSAKIVAKSLAAVMVETGHAGSSQFIVDDIAAELECRGVLSVGRVTSASILTAQLRQALTGQLKKATGAGSVLLEERIDKSVIGGLRVETANRVWDRTIARKLQQLKEIT